MKPLAIMFVPLIFMLAMPMQAGQAESDNSLGDRALELIGQLRDGDFEAPQKVFDPTMRQALAPERLGQTWRGIVAQAGALESIAAAGSSEQGIYRVAHVDCRFERMHLVADVVFDTDDAVVGLFFRPVAADSTPP